jgi:aryl-alcohol dehydrogenase-like predicted oxidoreductase
MKQVPLGKSGPTVSVLGLGCMGMSGMYGPADRKESLATLQVAVDAGINLLDTGDFYGMGHNELLIGEALKVIPRRRVLLSVKFGALRDPSGAWAGYDARPEALKTSHRGPRRHRPRLESVGSGCHRTRGAEGLGPRRALSQRRNGSTGQ